MRHVFLLLLSLTAALLWSCGDCVECGVINNEPRLRIEFHNSVNDGNIRINIDSINNRYSGDIELINDTLLHAYTFPLDMLADQSTFMLKTFKSADTLEESPLFDTLTLSYELVIEQTIRNRYRYVARQIDVDSHTFDSTALICTFSNCEMDDTVLEVYY